jgi:membrane-associated phospholipid phosphatase
MIGIVQALSGFDRTLLYGLNEWASSSLLISYAARIVNLTIAPVIACSLVSLWFADSDRHTWVRNKLLVFMISLAPTYLIARLIAQSVVLRPRPLIALSLSKPRSMTYETWYKDKSIFTGMGSFPSDHAALVTMFTVILFSIDRRLGYVGLTYLFVVGALRVSLGYHWPSDMVGGAVLGGLLGYLALRLEQRFRVGISNSIKRVEMHASLIYPFGFLFLFEFANGFRHLRKISYDLLKYRLFH